jgi:hypothetical protein
MRILSGLKTKVLVLLATAAASAGLLIGTAAPAAASSYGTFDAWCGYNHTVEVEGPDLSTYPGWSTRWYPTLYRWTTAGWQVYRYGPTQSQAGATTWTMPESITYWTFTNLPTGYYQARATFTYFYNGIAQGTYSDRLLTHKPVPNDPFSYLVVHYSTSDYCYEG